MFWISKNRDSLDSHFFLSVVWRREKFRNQNTENRNEVVAKISHLFGNKGKSQATTSESLYRSRSKVCGVRSFLAYKLWVHSFIHLSSLGM